MYTVHCTVYTTLTLYSVHCTLYTVRCTLYTVHCTLYTVHCTLYAVRCTQTVQRNAQYEGEWEVSRGYNQRNCRAIRDFLPTMSCTQYNVYLLNRMYNIHFSGYIHTVQFRNVEWEISTGNRFLMTWKLRLYPATETVSLITTGWPYGADSILYSCWF